MSKSIDRFIRLPEVLHVTGVGRSTLFSMIAANQFPRQIKISTRCSAWLESAVLGWCRDRIAASRREPEQRHG